MTHDAITSVSLRNTDSRDDIDSPSSLRSASSVSAATTSVNVIRLSLHRAVDTSVQCVNVKDVDDATCHADTIAVTNLMETETSVQENLFCQCCLLFVVFVIQLCVCSFWFRLCNVFGAC